MLHVTTGHFHPDLEEAITHDLRTVKQEDPLSPLTIVVPSGSLRRYLTWVLCRQYELSLLNVQVVTFFQLANRLLRENPVASGFNVRSEFYFKERIRECLNAPSPALARWRDLKKIPGAWAALWSSIKDLKDALVDPAVVLDWLRQENLDAPRDLNALLALYEVMLAERNVRGNGDRDDVAVLALNLVGTSRFLAKQRLIMYYGFYDLTQVQLDVFGRIARLYPTNLYFPLIPKHPAYRFAERFFQQHVRGLLSGSPRVVTRRSETDRLAAVFADPATGDLSEHVTDLVDSSGNQSGENPQPAEETRFKRHAPQCRIIHVSGMEDEVIVVAKDILGYVRDRGVAFHEIGVIARTLSGYESVLPRIFGAHAIPFDATLTRPFVAFPLVKTAMRLLELPLAGFRREEVMDVIGSPFFRVQAFLPDRESTRPDLWDVLSRELGIVKGIKEWQRLERSLEVELLHGEENGLDRGSGPNVHEHRRNLWSVVSRLHSMFQDIPACGTWGEYVSRTARLFEKCLAVPDGNGDSRHAPERNLNNRLDGSKHRSVALADLLRQLDELRTFDETADSRIEFREFVEAFGRLMGDVALPVASESVDSRSTSAVQVLDAMAARGLSFRVVYLLGMTENTFPRHIREDAFLPDATRRQLERDLGFKVPEKLIGYDEEKLLFYLIINSAQESLTLLAQRTDQEGRTQLPSRYLDEVKRVHAPVSEIQVPRRVGKKFREMAWFATDRLSPRELLMKGLLNRQWPTLNPQEDPGTGLLVAGLRYSTVTDNPAPRLTTYDGITGPLEAFWASLKSGGLSATALERYARCPFQYFAQNVLRLRPLPNPETVIQIRSQEAGSLFHEILKDSVQALLDRPEGWAVLRTNGAFRHVVQKTVETVCRNYAAHHAVGYPLLWELQQVRILELACAVVQADFDEMGDQWKPWLFEETLNGTISIPLDRGDETFRLTGRLDRVDWSSSQQAFRIIDYKYTEKRSRSAEDKNLELSAIRGRRLQPPLYVKLAVSELATRHKESLASNQPRGSSAACEGFWFYFAQVNRTDEPWVPVKFPGDAWDSSLRQPVARALTTLVEGIRAGQFFITPGSHCESCEFRGICRKTHQPTAWRARTDQALIRPLRLLRRATLKEQQGKRRSSSSVDHL